MRKRQARYTPITPPIPLPSPYFNRPNIRQRSRKSFPLDKLPRKTLSRLTGAFPEPNTARYTHCGGHDPDGVGALFFFFFPPATATAAAAPAGHSQPAEALSAGQLFWIRCEDLFVRERGILQIKKEKRKNKKKTRLLISPCRTETAGAFQQLDLVRFHRWLGVREDVRGSHLEKLHCLSATVFIAVSRAGGDPARLRCEHTVKTTL